jgi:predicted metallo-beta-lactamase superfamily hydrolase
MARIAQGSEVFVHTGDVEGPPLKEQLGFLLDAEPTVLYADGPMTHMPDNYPAEYTKRSLANLERIMRSTPLRTLILDHHLLRDREWKKQIEPLAATAAEHDITVTTAAEYAGKAVDQLEAHRDRLYGLDLKP